jgi:mannose-6-phosphate isomerase-like protein (cupin superfamily)
MVMACVVFGAILLWGVTRSTARALEDPSTLILRRADVMSRPPDIDAPNVRVWTMRRTVQSRTNLVEMKGKLSYHQHPDADHTLLVLEGEVCAWYGRKVTRLVPGDYISIPKGVPHKYETVTPRALLMSFDAPAYDPDLTQKVPEPADPLPSCSSH